MFPFIFMTWLTNILWMLKGRRPCPPFPDDILIQIISRLPFEDALRWRLVSRKLKELVSELHTKRTTPSSSSTILVRMMQSGTARMKYFLIGKDYWQAMNPKNISNPKTYSNRGRLGDWALFTYNGLLVYEKSYLHDQSSFHICNPITREEVTLYKGQKWLICGLVQHPYTKDYRVLAVSRGNKGYAFYIRCFVPRSPEHKHYWRQLVGNIGYCPVTPVKPLTLKPPVVVNDAIHWICKRWQDGGPASCLESILVFDIVSERFTVRPHPSMVVCHGSLEEDHHDHMHLLEMGGELALCVLDFHHSAPVKIDIWVLKDYGNWRWTKKHATCLDTGTRDHNNLHCSLYPIGVFDGELLMHWKTGASLFVYNLKQGTISKREDAFKNELGVTMFRYSRSLVSLKNFEPCY